MQFDLRKLTPTDCYKLMTGCVVPRPIALVSTLSPGGLPNAAPFSFFNVMGSDPPVVVLGIADRGGVPKHTAANIHERGEFVINLVSEAIAERMNVCATDFDEGVNELEVAGLTPAACRRVGCPRIAESPVSFECRYVSTTMVRRSRVIIGEAVYVHIADGVVDERLRVDADAMKLIGRMHGPSGYVRLSDRFELKRLPPEAFGQKPGKP
ncbi:MAG: flavin reductase family protein [Phycisphaerae bacterium]